MNNPVVVDENNRRIVVVVTGFGPFECVTENPSSLIVEQLRNGDPLDGIELIAEILPVRYDVVADTIDELWRQHKPSLVVHLGVHHQKRTICVEQQSFGRGYCRFDINGMVPTNNICSISNNDCSSDILCSQIDCNAVVRYVREHMMPTELIVKVSHDPGRYLCAFSYYRSLVHDSSRVIFVHVPPVERHVSIDMQTSVVKHIIKYCVEQLHTTGDKLTNEKQLHKTGDELTNEEQLHKTGDKLTNEKQHI